MGTPKKWLEEALASQTWAPVGRLKHISHAKTRYLMMSVLKTKINVLWKGLRDTVCKQKEASI